MHKYVFVLSKFKVVGASPSKKLWNNCLLYSIYSDRILKTGDHSEQHWLLQRMVHSTHNPLVDGHMNWLHLRRVVF